MDTTPPSTLYVSRIPLRSKENSPEEQTPLRTSRARRRLADSFKENPDDDDDDEDAKPQTDKGVVRNLRDGFGKVAAGILGRLKTVSRWRRHRSLEDRARFSISDHIND